MYFSTKFQAMRKRDDIFTLLKEEKLSTKNSLPTKLYFSNGIDIKTSLRKKKASRVITLVLPYKKFSREFLREIKRC